MLPCGVTASDLECRSASRAAWFTLAKDAHARGGGSGGGGLLGGNGLGGG
jgi:hypothetical protein